MFPPPLQSAPQSWYNGCPLESLSMEVYNPNTTATCPGPWSQNSGWAPPGLLAQPSIAPNSAAGTTVANSTINGGSDGAAAVAASPAAAAASPGQSLGPASFSHPVPQPLPPYWNSGPPQPPSIGEQLSTWACKNPALAAVAVGVTFFVFWKGGKR